MNIPASPYQHDSLEDTVWQECTAAWLKQLSESFPWLDKPDRAGEYWCCPMNNKPTPFVVRIHDTQDSEGTTRYVFDWYDEMELNQWAKNWRCAIKWLHIEPPEPPKE
jgi:hypothetical protein